MASPEPSPVSFGAALARQAPALQAYLRRLGGRPEDLEDLVQETLTRAWSYRAGYDAARPLRRWLLRIGLRVWIDHRSRVRRDPRSLGDFSERVPDARGAEGDVAARLDVARLLARLRPIERDVLLRFHRDEWTILEIARDLSLPEGTVKSHLHRARRKLAGGES